MRFLSCLAVTAALLSCSTSKNAAIDKAVVADNKVIAHRGAWKKQALPQNSIASLKQAIALRCGGSEFDVRMTADDSLIINHDPHYLKLPVEESTYAELVTAGKLSNGEKLPTLREYILAGMEGNTTTRLICEIKPSVTSKERGQAIAARVVALVQALNAQPMVDYISFDYDILKKIVAIDPRVATQYLQGDRAPELLAADGISGADFNLSVYKQNPSWIDSAKKLKITLNVWTVNTAEDMDWFLARGFDLITTDEPELLLERIKRSPAAAGR